MIISKVVGVIALCKFSVFHFYHLVVLMFPMSTSSSAVSEFDSGMEKLIFQDPQSLRELSKKSVYPETHFHVASTFPVRGNG